MTCLDTPFFQIQPQENADLAAAQAFDTQVTYTWPHVHWIENLMTISATLALPGGTAFYLYGNEVRMWVASCVRSWAIMFTINGACADEPPTHKGNWAVWC